MIRKIKRVFWVAGLFALSAPAFALSELEKDGISLGALCIGIAVLAAFLCYCAKLLTRSK